jgi:cation diffusion facilitator CzcD-associated flavoprotein CzcO
VADITDDVIVIGAGAAGLGAAGALAKRGVRAQVLERSHAVGASWRARHDHLHLNTHRWFSHLPGKPIASSAGTLPSRDAFVAYLEDYVREFDIAVDFGVDVRQITPAPDRGWRIACNDRDRHAKHVIIGTGSERVPVNVSWPGLDTFLGEVIHSAEFRCVQEYSGRDVLIVGAGNSGFDLTNHLCTSEARRLWLSVRSGPTILPLRVAGRPLHPVAVANKRLPVKLQDRLLTLVSRAFFGDLTPYGIPRPREGALSRALRDHVTVSLDDGTVAAIKAGRIEVVPTIERFEGPDVVLTNGERIQPDAVICATGYRPGLEDLVGDLVPLDETGQPPATGADPTPDRRGLWFFGVTPRFTGNMYVQLHEAKRLAARIASDLNGG